MLLRCRLLFQFETILHYAGACAWEYTCGKVDAQVVNSMKVAYERWNEAHPGSGRKPAMPEGQAPSTKSLYDFIIDVQSVERLCDKPDSHWNMWATEKYHKYLHDFIRFLWYRVSFPPPFFSFLFWFLVGLQGCRS